MDQQAAGVGEGTRAVSPSCREDESVVTSLSSQTIVEDACRLDEKVERRLRRKIDGRLVPLVSILFLLSCFDRTNLGIARRAGLENDLAMSGKDDFNVRF